MIRKVDNAFLFALRVHDGQIRKDGKPYISHPFSVAMILAENGADDDLICAGLLHDTIEDGGVTAEELRQNFGDEVARLVLFDTENKKKSWKERKDATIHALQSCDKKCAMLVCADKVSNLSDIAEKAETEGDDVWKRFSYGKREQRWLYTEYAEALAELNELQMYKDLVTITNNIFSEGDKQ